MNTRQIAMVTLLALVPVTSYGGDVGLMVNDSKRTTCAEEDNINIPLLTPVSGQQIASFVIEATHPTYPWTVDHTAPDFSNCSFPPGQDYTFANPQSKTIYSDGKTAIVAIREAKFWQPTGMTAVGNQGSLSDTHYIAVHRMVAPGDYPQFLVIYADGNVRLKAQPPMGRADTIFGSSVIVGPALRAARPVVDIEQLTYRPENDSLFIRYASGESATFFIEQVDRTKSRIRVETSFDPASSDTAFAIFRSMFVANGNSDADSITWVTPEGQTIVSSVMDMTEATGTDFFLSRQFWSKHNTSAPDIRISELKVVPEASTGLGLAVGLSGLALHRRRRSQP